MAFIIGVFVLGIIFGAVMFYFGEGKDGGSIARRAQKKRADSVSSPQAQDISTGSIQGKMGGKE